MPGKIKIPNLSRLKLYYIDIDINIFCLKTYLLFNIFIKRKKIILFGHQFYLLLRNKSQWFNKFFILRCLNKLNSEWNILVQTLFFVDTNILVDATFFK